MARITRKQQKIFAENATNNGVFGSLQGNDPTISSDPDTIQSLAAFQTGWNSATYSAELLPPLEEFQALQFLFSRQIAYGFQEGIAEWDSNTTYYKGSIVKKISGTQALIYVSLADNNTNNAVTNTSKWKLIIDSNGGYADLNLSNINSSAKNISNWCTNVTNCVTEIPQDITLTLSSGVATLASGSNVYVPNGSGVFTKYTTASNLTSPSLSSVGDQQGFLFVSSAGTNMVFDSKGIGSGTTFPETAVTGNKFYKTDNDNKFYRYDGSTWVANGYSFPIALVTVKNHAIESIDQVFNGMGFIGSSLFVLPGVKGLYPDGRNADGTLKSVSINVTSARVTTNTSATSSNNAVVLGSSSIGVTSSPSYNEAENKNYSGTTATGNLFCAYFDRTNGVVSNFRPNTVFHAIDYSQIVEDTNVASSSDDIVTTKWIDNKIVVVASLPDSPDPNVYYFVTG